VNALTPAGDLHAQPFDGTLGLRQPGKTRPCEPTRRLAVVELAVLLRWRPVGFGDGSAGLVCWPTGKMRARRGGADATKAPIEYVSGGKALCNLMLGRADATSRVCDELAALALDRAPARDSGSLSKKGLTTPTPL
jgi:hypothetical protein